PEATDRLTVNTALVVPAFPSVTLASLIEIPGVDVTVCETLPLLGLKLVLPLYSAVIVWLPALRFDVLKNAWPLALRAVGPASTVTPSLNVTLPCVTALPLPVTVAVNVTDWPKTDGLSEDDSAVRESCNGRLKMATTGS